jgi:hypothetical protein
MRWGAIAEQRKHPAQPDQRPLMPPEYRQHRDRQSVHTITACTPPRSLPILFFPKYVETINTA